MPWLAGVLAAAAGVSAGAASCEHRKIAVDSLPQQYLSGEAGEAWGDKVAVGHNQFIILTDGCDDPAKVDPAHITQLKLLGKTLYFTTDLSKVGCACNLALYLVSAPARDPSGSGQPYAGRGDYYCDANQVGGQWCPEIDIMEANNHALQATPHKCDPPGKGNYYTSCDRGGCALNTRDQGNAFGPGSQFRLNTLLPFDVETSFPVDGNGQLAGMRTVLKQGSQEVVLDHNGCAAGYLASLTEAMKEGMSLIFSYWGSDSQTMSWMDMPPCGPQACTGDNSGLGTISKLGIRDYTGPAPGTPSPAVPTPAPTPSPPPPPPADLSMSKRLGAIHWKNHPEKCLAAQGSWQHAPVIIMDCQGDEKALRLQLFESLGDGKLRLAAQRDRCITVLEHVASNGSRIELSECIEGDSSQTFGYPATDGKIRWAGQPSMCLDVKGHWTDNGTPLQLWSCLSSDTDQQMDWRHQEGEGAFGYDCSDDSDLWYTWEAAKRDWCCLQEGKACGTFTTTSRPLFDCSFGYPEWVPMWNSEKKAFCCRTERRGCPQGASGGARLPPARDSQAEAQLTMYDCFSFLQDDWSESHKHWCCKYERVACPPGESDAGDSSEPLGEMRYDCEWGKENWYEIWPVAQADWCCRRSGVGCRADEPRDSAAAAAADGWPSGPSLPAEVATACDCELDKAEWMFAWSKEKRECCCRKTGKEGCSEPGPPVHIQRYDRLALPEAARALGASLGGSLSAAALVVLGTVASLAASVAAVRRFTARSHRGAAFLRMEDAAEWRGFVVE